jgi:hypothetical protein
MDGVLLVFDSRKLPNLHALTPVPPKTPHPKRNRAVPAFASLILALVLGMVYYVSIPRKAPQNAYTPPAASAATTTVNAVPEVKPAPEAQPSETAQPEAVEEVPKSSPKVVTTPVVRKPAARATPTQVRPTTEAKKEDSKVGSILKKTGRILKKPFKF